MVSLSVISHLENIHLIQAASITRDKFWSQMQFHNLIARLHKLTMSGAIYSVMLVMLNEWSICVYLLYIFVKIERFYIL